MSDQLPPARYQSVAMDDERTKSARTIATVIYGLQALGFFFVIPTIVAIVMAHVKMSDARGTWVESHFRWQIRSFWFGVLWGIIGLVLVFWIVGYFILIAAAIWLIYRVVKGWLRLYDGKEMYQQT